MISPHYFLLDFGFSKIVYRTSCRGKDCVGTFLLWKAGMMVLGLVLGLVLKFGAGLGAGLGAKVWCWAWC